MARPARHALPCWFRAVALPLGGQKTSVSALFQRFKRGAGFNKVVKAIGEFVHNASIAATHVKPFVARTEHCKRWRIGIDDAAGN